MIQPIPRTWISGLVFGALLVAACTEPDPEPDAGAPRAIRPLVLEQIAPTPLSTTISATSRLSRWR
jgi:hypothetical protein